MAICLWDSSAVTPLEAMTNVIGHCMASGVTQISNNGKRRMLNRQHGQSLITMDVLLHLQPKERVKRRPKLLPASRNG